MWETCQDFATAIAGIRKSWKGLGWKGPQRSSCSMGRDISHRVRLFRVSFNGLAWSTLSLSRAWTCPGGGREKMEPVCEQREAGLVLWHHCRSSLEQVGMTFSHCLPHVGAGHVLCWSPPCPGEARTDQDMGVLALLWLQNVLPCRRSPPSSPPSALLFPPLFKFISLRQPGLSLLENYSDKSSLSSNYLNGGKGGEIHLESTSLRD